jgi:serine/threonine-protein kinase HipA
MAGTEQKLVVFSHLDTDWVPCGQLTLTEDGAKLLASTFAYGLRYLQRPGALEVDPVSLSLRDKNAVRGKALFPPNELLSFRGIRDAAPDAWGRRVIESRLKVPANSLSMTLMIAPRRGLKPDSAGGCSSERPHDVHKRPAASI